MEACTASLPPEAVELDAQREAAAVAAEPRAQREAVAAAEPDAQREAAAVAAAPDAQQEAAAVVELDAQ